MRHNQCVCLIFCSITLIWGCQSHISRVEDTATETTSSFVQQPKAILVPLPDPLFIAASGSDSNGVINLTISDKGSFGFGTSGRIPYKMLTFCFVDSDCENNIPPRIYVGCESPNDIGARMLTPRESAAVVEVLEQYLESHYNQDKLRSLSRIQTYLLIAKCVRSLPIVWCTSFISINHTPWKLTMGSSVPAEAVRSSLTL